MFSYGTIYRKLSDPALSLLFGKKLGELYASLARFYLGLFGYPDIAGQLRYPLAIKLLNPQNREKILDAGCGNGIYANSIAHLFGSEVIGVDLNEEHINRAKAAQKSLRSSAKFKKISLTDLAFKPASFNKIISMEVLEHIKDDKRALLKLSRVLKRGGFLVLSVPKKKEKLSQKELEEYKNPKYLGHVRSGYSEDEIRKLAKEKGLTLEKKIKYYRLFSDFAIRIQQFFDLNGTVLLNIITYPFLNLLAHLDFFLGKKRYFKGYIFLFKKQ